MISAQTLGCSRVNPGAAELQLVTVVRRGVSPTAQAIARFDQHRASTAHRQLARGGHAGEAAADDHDVRRRTHASPSLAAPC